MFHLKILIIIKHSYILIFHDIVCNIYKDEIHFLRTEMKPQKRPKEEGKKEKDQGQEQQQQQGEQKQGKSDKELER